jgi:membrane associated rhomboid family serine protease
MNYRPQGFTLLPPVIKNLLIINFLMFMGTTVFSGMGLNLVKWLALYFPASPNFMPHQLVTHMFMHGDFGHVFFNMFALWIFGTALENLWGSKRFLIFYFVTGLGASLVHMGVHAIQYYDAINHLTPELMSLVEKEGYGVMMSGQAYKNEYLNLYNQMLHVPTLGASGAVFGILLAFGMTFPNQYIYLYFLLPIKAKWFVIIYGALELYNGIMYTNDGIAHFAHLGGMLFGFFLIRYWRKNQFRQW